MIKEKKQEKNIKNVKKRKKFGRVRGCGNTKENKFVEKV